MAKSLYNVSVKNGATTLVFNVLAQESDGHTSLQNAVAAALTGVGDGAELMNATEVYGKPTDYEIAAAVSPATDLSPKQVYQVSFRRAEDGTMAAPLMILSWPQDSSGTTTAAYDLALQKAEAEASATANAVIFVGAVDVDATV